MGGASSFSLISTAHDVTEAITAKAIASPEASVAVSPLVGNTSVDSPRSYLKGAKKEGKEASSVSSISAAHATAEAMAAKALAAADASIAEWKVMSPRANNVAKSSSTLRDSIDKLEESLSTRSDKENSHRTSDNAAPIGPQKFQFYDRAETNAAHLAATLATLDKEAPLPANDGGAQRTAPPLSPTKKSVREVDALLAKTRNWLVRHQDARLTQSSKYPPLSSSPEEREVMGNITAKTAEINSKLSASVAASKSQAPSIKANLTDQLKPLLCNSMRGSQSSVKATDSSNDTRAASISSLASSSSASGEGSKKSILEQLEEIRAKQNNLELRQKTSP